MKDRRVRKTEESIRKALIELLSEKDIRKITIKELCEKADINKSTFYLHYEDIYHCADSFIDEVLEKIKKITHAYSLSDMVDKFPLILSGSMKVFYENEGMKKLLVKSHFLDTYMGKIKEAMIEHVLEKASKKEKKEPYYKESAVFIVNGLMGVLQSCSYEEINEELAMVLGKKIRNGFKCIFS